MWLLDTDSERLCQLQPAATKSSAATSCKHGQMNEDLFDVCSFLQSSCTYTQHQSKCSLLSIILNGGPYRRVR